MRRGVLLYRIILILQFMFHRKFDKAVSRLFISDGKKDFIVAENINSAKIDRLKKRLIKSVS